MIVVCVLLQSAITGKVTEIARMHVSNTGEGTCRASDYDVTTLRGRKTSDFEKPIATRTGKVVGHRRLDLHVWHLVSKALQAVGYGTPKAEAAAPTNTKVIEMLLGLVYAVWCALDDSEEIDGDRHIIDGGNFKALCDAIDAIEELPDDRPGYTMGAAAKARWALRSLIGQNETSRPQQGGGK